MVGLWYYPLKKEVSDRRVNDLEGTNTMKNTDVLGRLLKPGDVCGFASRRSSQTNLEVVIIRELKEDGIRADKVVKEWVNATAGWQVKLVKTHKILVPSHLIITGMTEKEAVDLMRIRSER